MTATIMLFIYLAGIIGDLKFVCGTLAFLSILGGAIATIVNSTYDDFPKGIGKYLKIPIIILSITSSLIIFIPSKDTMYMMAGVYIGGQAVDTDEFKLVRQLVTNKLTELVKESIPTEKKVK